MHHLQKAIATIMDKTCEDGSLVTIITVVVLAALVLHAADIIFYFV